ncbi:MAG: type II toxin-antitoxin system RelE/ParE family toxin [Bacteroidetes bacterium]|nr:MAG: type II toxin-antitoxin system RelE/ParE family toxin [Bacteroidota bacterium]
MGFFELSLPAQNDLEDIFEYSESEFGTDQAINYLLGLDLLFNKLVEAPEIGRERNEIKRGLRSIVEAEHIIFYRIMADRIRIIRILHGSRDLPKFF